MAASTMFRASNMVMVTHLSQTLSLPSVYELLTLVGVDFMFGTKQSSGSRVKIPYFGVEGAIVSVRFKNQSRGIRNEGGQLRNVVAVDLQYSGKNIHLKVSEKKIALMGALTEAMGNGAFQKLLEHLTMVQDHWIHMRTLSIECHRATIKWLCELLHGEPIIHHITGASTSELKKLTDAEMQEAFSKKPADVDERAAMYLAMFVHEFKYYPDFIAKLDILLTLPITIYNTPPVLGAGIIHNAVYNYSVGHRVSLITLCRELHAKGYMVSYHNWVKSKAFHVMMPIVGREQEIVEDEDVTPIEIEEASSPPSTQLPLPDEGELPTPRTATDVMGFPPNTGTKTQSKQPAHRFMIYQSGSIRQSSPTIHTAAEQVMMQLVKDILQIITPAP